MLALKICCFRSQSPDNHKELFRIGKKSWQGFGCFKEGAIDENRTTYAVSSVTSNIPLNTISVGNPAEVVKGL